MQNQTAPRPYGVPESFYSKFGQYVTAVLSGFDRIRFRATLRPLFCPEGPEVYLNHCKVLIKHFKGFAQGLSDRVKKLAYERFQQLGRPNIYCQVRSSVKKHWSKTWLPRSTSRKDRSLC